MGELGGTEVSKRKPQKAWVRSEFWTEKVMLLVRTKQPKIP